MAGYKFAHYIIIGNECGTYLLLHKVLRLVLVRAKMLLLGIIQTTSYFENSVTYTELAGMRSRRL